MLDESIADVVREYLLALRAQGVDAQFGVVFGSYATGKADEWSDIDLLVASPLFDAPVRQQDVDMLWVTAAKVDSRIEPIPCGVRQWSFDDTRAIVEIARREGVVVPIERETTAAKT